MRWVQKASKHVTLAIGDGGNDVSMLLQSDCGVGIRGREGEQVSPAGRCDVGCARGRLRGAGVSIAGATAVRARSEGPEPELDDHGVFAVQIGGAVRVPDHVLAVHAVLRSLAVLLAASHLLLDRPLRFSFFFYFAHSRSPSSDSSSNAFTPTRTFSPTRSSTPTPTAPRPSIRRPTPSAASSPFSRSRWRRA